MSDTDKEINWLTRKLSCIDYSRDKNLAIVYELGLLRSMLAQCLHSDNNNIAIVKTIIERNPYYKTPL